MSCGVISEPVKETLMEVSDSSEAPVRRVGEPP